MAGGYLASRFALPAISRGQWNLVPQVSIVNTDPSAPFLVRTQLSGGTYARHLARQWPRVESNHRTQLRRLPLCPLSYGAETSE